MSSKTLRVLESYDDHDVHNGTTSKFGMPNVVLVSLPWTTPIEPPVGVAILKARLNEVGIPCKIMHLNVDLLRYVSARSYIALADAFGLNDFLFTFVIEGFTDERRRALLGVEVARLFRAERKRFKDYPNADALTDALLLARQELIPAYLNQCVERVVAENPTMVGATCMFDQTIPSVALAYLLRQRIPNVLIALGGYAVFQDVGRHIIETFPWIDVVASGDGEDVIEALAHASVDRTKVAQVPGIIFRREHEQKTVAFGPPSQVSNLNSSPTPDYSDFATDLEHAQRDFNVSIPWQTIPIEASRGCWWGQKSHCVFCGIDDDTMRYRQKEASTVRAMLDALASRHQIRSFRFVDYILPHTYHQDLLPSLAASGAPYRLHCEIKANMTAERFSRLVDAGFRELQPGIESFSSSVLKKMRKGVSGIQNALLLVLAFRAKVELHYNMLYGFPSDEPGEYLEMLRMLPCLYHLAPPTYRDGVAITRYAPMHINGSSFGYETKSLKADPRYDLVFSEEFSRSHGWSPVKYCYYFEKSYSNSDELESLYSLLRLQVQHWKSGHVSRSVRCAFTDQGNSISFFDSRFSQEGESFTLSGIHRSVYLKCYGDIRTVDEVASLCLPIPVPEVQAAVADLVDARVLLREGNRVTGVAISSDSTREPDCSDFIRGWRSLGL